LKEKKRKNAVGTAERWAVGFSKAAKDKIKPNGFFFQKVMKI